MQFNEPLFSRAKSIEQDRLEVRNCGCEDLIDPSEERRSVMQGIGVNTHDDWSILNAAATIPVVLAVKPQMLRAVQRECGALGGRGVISILAGTPISKISELLETDRVVRMMPNTPARLRRGMSAIARGPGATDEDMALASSVAMAVGEVLQMLQPQIEASGAHIESDPLPELVCTT